MILLKALVALTSLTSLADAFLPYVPPYMCGETDIWCDDATNTKRSIHSVPLEDALTFELKQRRSKNDVSHEDHLRAVVDRATRKYASRVARNSLIKKGTNSYSVVLANTPTLDNSIALNQDGTDFSYFATINFGSKQKPIYMLMDTGASSTWVMGDSCTTDACSKHNSFGAADSDTFKSTTTPFNINYGSGIVNGTYATDSVSFAGLTLDLTFGSAVYTSNDFLNFPMDGIMGLGRSGGSTDTPNFMSTLVASQKLKNNVIGININRNSDGAKDGEINFGGTDSSKYTGDLTYSAVSGDGGDWVIPVDDVGFKGSKSGATGKTAYIDTGTSFIFIPPTDAQKLYASIPGASSSDGSTYTVPCDTTDPIQFWFSGVSYSVSAKDWVGGKNGDACTSNIYARQLVGADSWLLGDTFLKNVYAVFDVDQNRIGFGAKSQPSAATSTSSSASSPQGSSSTPAVTSTEPAASTPGSATSSSEGSQSDSVTPPGSSATSTPGSSPTGSSTPAASSSGSVPLIGGSPASSQPGEGSSSSSSSTTSPAPASTTTQGSAATQSNLLDTRYSILATVLVLAVSFWSS